MRLSEITNENLVFTNQKLKTKNEVIQFLVEKLDENGKLYSKEEYLNAVLHRETLSPTGFEGGLAIPHGKSNGVKEASFAVMTIDGTIEDWESLDPNNKVNLVFLLAIPESEAGDTHLKVLSELITRLSDENYKNSLLQAKTSKQLYEKIDQDKKEEIVENVQKIDKTILAITACPAGIAHTYMAADALVKAGKKLGVDVYVEKQGANGIEDPHTKELIKKADVIIYATDVAPKNTERFSHLPSLKTAVAQPLKKGEELIKEALEIAEKQGKGEYVEIASTEETNKSSFKKDIKSAILTGVSYIIPIIVAGGMILAAAVLISQGFGLQDLYNEEGSWLWQLRKLSGGMLGTLMTPVLAAYMSFSLAEKPGLGPGFAAGIAANLIGSGFLGGMVGGLVAGYTIRLLKKYIPAKGTLAGFVSFWVYPVFGSLIVGCIMLFLIGKPIAFLNDSLINWLNGLTGTNALILGAIIGAMVSFDLGGPINKAAYTFAIGAIASGNFVPYAVFASVKMVSAFGITFSTIFDKKIFTDSEKEIGKQTWILGLAGITEGAIPFMIEDPIRVIPSLVVGSAVTGAIVAYFNIGLQVPGAGIFSLALLESNMSGFIAAAIWFFAAVLGAVISAILLIATRKAKIKNNK